LASPRSILCITAAEGICISWLDWMCKVPPGQFSVGWERKIGRKLDLLLVHPGDAKMYQGPASFRGIEPPFWAGLIASFIRGHNYEVAVLDADPDGLNPRQTAERVVEYGPRLVAIIVQGVNPSASSTPKMTAAIDLVSELKSKGSKTLVAGLHPSALPERTLQETAADFVCQGEGFYTILGILQNMPICEVPGLSYWWGGNTITGTRAALLRPDELPPVAWDLLDISKYRAHNWHCLDDIDRRQPYGVIYTSLGCPYDCHYCQIKQLYSGRPGVRFRAPESVVEEIDLLVNEYGVRHIKFMDELFTISERQVASICDPIIEHGYDLNIWTYARIDTLTEPMLAKMKQSGINWICLGIESGSERVRRGAGKRFSQDRVGKAVGMVRESGINIIGNFIFGLPDDDLESMQATLDMAKEYNFEYVNFYTCMAYPGSQLYEDAVYRRDIKLPKSWDGYSQLSYETEPLPTNYLTSREVLDFRDKAFREYFRRPGYLRMIRAKFGDRAVSHIKGMSQHTLKRRLLKC